MKIDWYTDLREIMVPKFDAILIFRTSSSQNNNKLIVASEYEHLAKLNLTQEVGDNVIIKPSLRLKHLVDCFAVLIFYNSKHKEQYKNIVYKRQYCEKTMCIIDICKIVKGSLYRLENLPFVLYKIEDSKGKQIGFNVKNEVIYNRPSKYSFWPCKISQRPKYTLDSSHPDDTYFLYGKAVYQINENDIYDIKHTNTITNKNDVSDTLEAFKNTANLFIGDDSDEDITEYIEEYYEHRITSFSKLRTDLQLLIASMIDYKNGRYDYYYEQISRLQIKYLIKCNMTNKLDIFTVDFSMHQKDAIITTNYDRCYIVNNHRKYTKSVPYYMKNEILYPENKAVYVDDIEIDTAEYEIDTKQIHRYNNVYTNPYYRTLGLKRRSLRKKQFIMIPITIINRTTKIIYRTIITNILNLQKELMSFYAMVVQT